MCPGRGDFACRSHGLPAAWRRKQRSMPERKTSGSRTSRITASGWSINTSKVLRSTTVTAFAPVSIWSEAGAACDCDHVSSTSACTCGRSVRLSGHVSPVRLSALQTSEIFRRNRRWFVPGLNCSPDLRANCRWLVRMDQHGRRPFRLSLETAPAMKNVDRRGSVGSSGMGQLM